MSPRRAAVSLLVLLQGTITPLSHGEAAVLRETCDDPQPRLRAMRTTGVIVTDSS